MELAAYSEWAYSVFLLAWAPAVPSSVEIPSCNAHHKHTATGLGSASYVGGQRGAARIRPPLRSNR